MSADRSSELDLNQVGELNFYQVGSPGFHQVQLKYSAQLLQRGLGMLDPVPFDPAVNRDQGLLPPTPACRCRESSAIPRGSEKFDQPQQSLGIKVHDKEDSAGFLGGIVGIQRQWMILE
jgi:hypothetical protein